VKRECRIASRGNPAYIGWRNRTHLVQYSSKSSITTFRGNHCPSFHYVEQGILIMKNALICFALAAGTLAAPVLSFAQSNAPLTRAEVRADLVRVEQAGYNPSVADDATYPADIQAAEARIAAQDGPQTGSPAYGGVAQNGSSSSGASTRMSMNSNCVGPVSYCNVFFGS
jgi:hypothetical protein